MLNLLVPWFFLNHGRSFWQIDRFTSFLLQKWPCKLSVLRLFPETENIIIQAKIDDVEESYNNSLSKESLDREKVSETVTCYTQLIHRFFLYCMSEHIYNKDVHLNVQLKGSYEYLGSSM